MKKRVFLFTFLSIVFFLAPIMIYGTIPVMQIGPLPYRTITVDGDPGDWVDISPLVVDGGGDSPPEEDIVAVYGANDEGFLYFLMEFNELRMFNGTFNENGYTVCRFFIDIVPEGDPSNKGADFRIGFKTHVVLTETLIPTDVAVLEYYVPTDWLISECLGIQGESMGRFVEVAVPWDCIGGRNCFNCFFTASAQVNTDWAPDQDAEYLMIGCCPGTSPEPVGGALLPFNSVGLIKWVLIPIILIIVILLKKSKVTLVNKVQYPHMFMF